MFMDRAKIARITELDSMRTLTIFPINGQPYGKQIEDNDLSTMQKIVGGLIEAIYLDGIVIIVDEEGLCKGKPINKALTKIAGSPLVGDGFIMTMSDWEKDT